MAEQPQYLYCSLHASGPGFYPETAQSLEVTPSRVNVPLPSKTRPKEFLAAFEVSLTLTLTLIGSLRGEPDTLTIPSWHV